MGRGGERERGTRLHAAAELGVLAAPQRVVVRRILRLRRQGRGRGRASHTLLALLLSSPGRRTRSMAPPLSECSVMTASSNQPRAVSAAVMLPAGRKGVMAGGVTASPLPPPILLPPHRGSCPKGSAWPCAGCGTRSPWGRSRGRCRASAPRTPPRRSAAPSAAASPAAPAGDEGRRGEGGRYTPPLSPLPSAAAVLL